MKKITLIVGTMASALMYSQVGINTTMPQATFHVDGGKDNGSNPTPDPSKQIDDFVVNDKGQAAIGTVSPDASAILDVSNLNPGSTKRGFLGPKVALVSRTDQVTIASPAAGLLAYNLGTAGLNYTGYVYWDGNEWRSLNNSSLENGTVGSITCTDVSLSPGTYTSGVPYSGTMNVPYTGGNGGTYPVQTIGPVNGLTATISPGNFSSGSGTLSYTVTGTPTVSSPVTTTFSLNIGGQSCSAVVGAGTTIAQGEMTFYHKSITYSQASTSNWLLSSVLTDLPVLDGTFRIDGDISGRSPFTQTGGSTNFNPRIYNVSSSNKKIWVSEMSTHTGDSDNGNVLLAPGNYVQLDDGVYFTQGYNETVTFDITTVDNKWYRIYYVLRVDNKSTVGTGTSGSGLNPTTDSVTTDNTIEVYISTQRLY